MVKIYIENKDKTAAGEYFTPTVLDKVIIEWEERSVPGRLTFSVIAEDTERIREGAAVAVRTENGRGIFYGFIFSIKYTGVSADGNTSGGVTEISAYDQLRYLKNKDTYAYYKKSASELLRMIARDFDLSVGSIENTGYIINSRIEENRTLFDIINSALELTYQASGRRFVLYDDFGALTLKSRESMKLDLNLSPSSFENYEYSSSIDTKSYNKIKLVTEDKSSGRREVYTARNNALIDSWGTLQYYAPVRNLQNVSAAAASLLSLYSKKTVKLKISGARSNIIIRPGAAMSVMSSEMTASKVKHIFKSEDHYMDIVFEG